MSVLFSVHRTNNSLKTEFDCSRHADNGLGFGIGFKRYLIIASVFLVLFLSGCTEQRVFMVPADQNLAIADVNNANFLGGISSTGFIRTNGSSTTTTSIPFAQGLSVPSNKSVSFGNSNDANAYYDGTYIHVDGAPMWIMNRLGVGPTSPPNNSGIVLQVANRGDYGSMANYTFTPTGTFPFVQNTTTEMDYNGTVSNPLIWNNYNIARLMANPSTGSTMYGVYVTYGSSSVPINQGAHTWYGFYATGPSTTNVSGTAHIDAYGLYVGSAVNTSYLNYVAAKFDGNVVVTGDLNASRVCWSDGSCQTTAAVAGVNRITAGSNIDVNANTGDVLVSFDDKNFLDTNHTWNSKQTIKDLNITGWVYGESVLFPFERSTGFTADGYLNMGGLTGTSLRGFALEKEGSIVGVTAAFNVTSGGAPPQAWQFCIAINGVATGACVPTDTNLATGNYYIKATFPRGTYDFNANSTYISCMAIELQGASTINTSTCTGRVVYN